MSSRGASNSRGRGPVSLLHRGRGRGRPATTVIPITAPHAAHVETVGLRRPGFGSSGRATEVTVNCFAATIPSLTIRHYDVIHPDEKVLPARLNVRIITELQTTVAPGIFTPRVVYDGRKNIFSSTELDFGGDDSMEFDVPLVEAGATTTTTARGPKIFKVKLTKVAEINTEVLQRFIDGIQSADNPVTTSITALNVVVRMQPILTHPFNARSFFTSSEKRDIGGGYELWRGLFQSVRATSGRLLVNVDISTGIFYKSGPLISICIDINKDHNPRWDTVEHLRVSRLQRGNPGLPDDKRRLLERKISGLRVEVRVPGSTSRQRVVKGLTRHGASELRFTLQDGRTITVAQYYLEFKNYRVRFPDILCAEVGNGNILPLELCHVVEGQMIRKQFPNDKVQEVLRFSTNRPPERLQRIIRGGTDLGYAQSEYLRSFVMQINPQPMTVKARVLETPRLLYGKSVGKSSATQSVVPKNGAWNMRDHKFFQPATAITRWVAINFAKDARNTDSAMSQAVESFGRACRATGIQINAPLYIDKADSGSAEAIIPQLMRLHAKFAPVQLILVVLPDGPVANEIYTKTKWFGDVEIGVPTQCLRAGKCFGGNDQYFANVALKVNVKLGGINTVPDTDMARTLLDPKERTMVIGADVIHPSPGSEGRPSFTAVVASVDRKVSKYISQINAQVSRQEIIEDLEEMVETILRTYMDYQEKVLKESNPLARKPTRIIFYRDGVSEGQFPEVLKSEVAALKKACAKLDINAKITFVIVGKRHHIRFFPTKAQDRDDRSGNCLAGTVIDSGITHPLEYDFYLQSHGGLLGTSRPSHYSVLYDDNQFSPDAMQSLTYLLCHLYARSTRSVSIPAPVYYADIVCSRSRNHYEPSAGMGTESGSLQNSNAPPTLEEFKAKFKPAHANIAKRMYFM